MNLFLIILSCAVFGAIALIIYSIVDDFKRTVGCRHIRAIAHPKGKAVCAHCGKALGNVHAWEHRTGRRAVPRSWQQWRR